MTAGQVDCEKSSSRQKRSADSESLANYYIDTIFWRLDNNYDHQVGGRLSTDSFGKLLSKINLGEMVHDHSDHDHDHSGHDHDDHDHSGHDHDDHDHSGHDHSGHDHRRKRSANETESDEDEADKAVCSMSGLLEEYKYDRNQGLDKIDFLYLCPALIDIMINDQCTKQWAHHDHDHGHAHGENEERNMALVWFYMFLCVTVISLCAVWGILCIPKKSRSMYNKVIQFLMAMAAGSMAGDALLHLLPHAMMPPHDHSAHSHEGHDHGDHDDHDAQHMDALLKGLVALLGLYLFFFLERSFTIYTYSKGAPLPKKKPSCHLHSHSAEPVEENIKFIACSPSTDTCITELTVTPDGNGTTHHWPHANGNGGDGAPVEDKTNKCPTLTPLALVIIVGDMFHNFCDGLAIGAGFASTTTLGLSTSLAVFCHELPHEIGDFAVLIKSGLSKKQAILFNFMSALTCYIGAIFGIFLGNVGNAPMWIFAAVSGMFLYIALVDLVPEMTHVYTTPGTKWSTYFALHVAGLFFGSLFMFILGIYEHDIQIALT